MSLPIPPPVHFQVIRGNQPYNYPAPRVYDSESRNRFCKEFEDYKWFLSEMRMLYPDSPYCEIDLNDWFSMRLAKVEGDKAVMLEKIQVLVERKRMRERKLPERKPPESNVIVYKNPTVVSGSRLAVFHGKKPGLASPFNSEKYSDQWTGTGSQVPTIIRKGLFPLPPSELLGSNTAHRDQWGNCRNIWGEVEPCGTETGHGFADVKDAVDHGATSRLSHSSSGPSSETALTLSSSVTTWSSPTQSLCTVPRHNYELGYTIAAKRPFHHGQTPTEAASAYHNERPDSRCSTESEDGYCADDEFPCPV
ncbi:hypothetical protein Q9L58_004797 [Maublancomyces gigas]|uniref:Uncharacterized protein n=1 Tax=Discina gigas TaxID=1032678 RepID=A0ABR3GL17_9PEZI